MQSVMPLLFKFITITFFLTLTVVRTIFKIQAGLFKKGFFSPEEGALPIVFRIILGLVLFAALGVFLFNLPYGEWTYLKFPVPLRFSGIFFCSAALALLITAHRTIGKYFSTTITIADDHHLITRGVYSRIQHPIYVSYLLLFFGMFLLTASWVIWLTGTGIILLLMTVRLKREEAALENRYGTGYIRYREKTGRFLPKRNRSVSETSPANR